MPNTGGGQGTPFPTFPLGPQVPYDQTEELDYAFNCAVPLSRYAKVVGYDEPAMWGVVYEGQEQNSCDTIWTESNRMQLENALASAQQMLEQFIGYPLCPTWVVGSVADEPLRNFRWVDQQKLSWRMLTRYPRVLAAGVRAVETVGTSLALTYSDDEFGVLDSVSVTFTDPNEIRVYYPGSNKRIYPSSAVIDSGVLTIRIPRYRMVVPDLLNTPRGGIMYEDLDNFLSAVDVYRVYNDPSRQGVLVRPGCRNNDCYGGCSECTHDACMYVRDPFIGQVELKPATWDTNSLTWNTASMCGTGYTLARLNYQAGVTRLDTQAENAVIHLAHTLMVTPPCACDWLQERWKTDQEYPSLLTREILNNPFGQGKGAWLAYCWAKSIASVRMMGFP